MRAEQVTDPVAYHAEGPVWSSTWGGLRWVDMLAGDVLSFDPAGGVARRHVGKVVAALRPRVGGGAVLALERAFALEDQDGTLHPGAPVFDDPGIRFNEGGCDPDGRFWCGTMGYDQQPGAGTVYRLEPEGRVQAVLHGVTVSNGLAWSPDGSLAYYNDTPTHRIDVFDSVDGELVRRRAFVDLTEEEASPDGLTVDAEGGVWTALNGSGEVRRYDAGGRLTDVVELPVRLVTACVLGGPRLDELYVTTSRENLPPDAEPQAGSLFRAAVGVPGLEPLPFAG